MSVCFDHKIHNTFYLWILEWNEDFLNFLWKPHEMLIQVSYGQESQSLKSSQTEIISLIHYLLK